MRSPCLITSRSTRRASGLDRSVRYFSQYRGECARVRIWSSASDSAVRSPRLAASLRSPTSLAWLMREARGLAISGSLRGTAAQAHLVAFPLGEVRLDRDLALERLAEALQPLLAVALEIPREVGMHADHDFAAAGLSRRGRLGLGPAEDLGRDGRVGLRDPTPLARRAHGREQRAQVLAHSF